MITAATGSLSYSAVGDPDGFTISGSGNLPFGSTLNLLGLAFNGGPTQTIALGVGSAALNVGSNPAGLTTDQRGTGFPRQVGPAVDIGAFEGVVDAPTAVAGPLPNVTTPGGSTYSFDVTYSGSTPINVSTLDNNDIRVTGPNGFNQLATFVSVTPAGNGSPRTATYRITAPGGTFDLTDNGTYTVSLQPGQVANTNNNTAAGATLGTFRVNTGLTYTVTNLDDSGTGSLRQAILDANASTGVNDTIVFQSGLSGTITLGSELLITDPVTINGPGASAVTVDGGGANRVFNVDGPGIIDVTIAGLTVTNGNSESQGDGGGIRTTDENLTLDRMVITGNTAGADNDGGGVTATTVAFITVRNSTISGNSGFYGGGIYFFNGGGLLMENSTVSGNASTGDVSSNGGGGIYFFGTASGFTIRNSTIAGNTSVDSGGGIVLRSFSGTALIQNSTITGNSANGTGTAAGQGGGGIAIGSGGTSSVLTIESSVISGNTSGNGNDDIAAITAATVNLNYSSVFDADGFTPTGGNNLAFGTDPLFDPAGLANNGGPTQTIALQSTSPLLNVGSNPANLTTDQRGPGFVRTSGSGTDIGAFELQSGTATPPRVTGVNVNGGQTNTTQRSRVTSIDVVFSTQVTFAGQVAAAFQLSRIGGGAVGGFTATANVVGGVTVVTLTGFTGAETQFGSLADGRYQVTALASQITAGGQQLDGDGNGTGGDNFVRNGTTANGLFRFYGDVNGDGTDNAADFGPFRAAFGTSVGNPLYRDFLDFNADSSINAADFAQFRTRFGASVP
jgi:hypothetical protein